MDSITVIPGDTLLYKFRRLDTDKYVEFAADILLNHHLFAAAQKPARPGKLTREHQQTNRNHH